MAQQRDEFATLTSAAATAAASAAINIVEGVGGNALGAVAGGAFEFFEHLAQKNDAAIAAFRLGALEDEVINLRNELRALERRLAAKDQKPDRQDPLSQTTAASEFVRNLSEARTVEKRTALVHATVAQFDPNRGSPALRDYWLRRVRELPDAELSLALVVSKQGQVAFLEGTMFQAHGGRGTPLPFGLTDVIGFATIAEQMANTGSGSLLHKTQAVIPHEARAVTVTAYALTRDGSTLVSFCRDD